ncbi:hypothetical protein [Acidomonas methanolica]|uniref:hypothetical protein n=1 Tax=Acidomonas methanolica TaxID=437 RepID=UPI00211A623C|nr:hypothetical protein [Acidomonas methanolica]MCQ9156576.1 hypothetical protein [Acidomonas methanolica]
MTFKILARTGLTVLLAAATLPAFAAHHHHRQPHDARPQAKGVAKWRSPYADGTGNSAVGDLNAAQLNQNYKGPYYYPGQPIPPARASILPPAASARGAAPVAPVAPAPASAPRAASMIAPAATHLPPPVPLTN